MNKDDDILLKDKHKIINKTFIIGFIITSIICLMITFMVIMQEIYGQGKDFNKEYLTILTDGFTISGGLVLLFYFLTKMSDEGAFDIFSYSVKLVWNITFHRNVRETNLPKTYQEYKQIKRAKEKSSVLFMLISGLLFFITGIIFYIIYKI